MNPFLSLKALVQKPVKQLDKKRKRLQIAFNSSLEEAQSVIQALPKDDRVLIEAGTPLLKREGMRAIETIRSMWDGYIVADYKIMDGARQEVNYAAIAGANAVTVLGAAPKQTIDLAAKTAQTRGIDLMIDFINVEDPLRVMRSLSMVPQVAMLHRGRDEENAFGKIIQYRHVARILSKFDCLISAAGGVDLKEAQSASFNGADIVVVNIVSPKSQWKGIRTDDDINQVVKKFLSTID